MLGRPSGFIALCLLLVAASATAAIGWRFTIFILPFKWTGEPARIAELLRLKAGHTVADIGAGDGSLAVEIARVVGAEGTVYATELSAERQRAIAARAERNSASRVQVVAAAEDATNLPDECCDAVYMRAVFHHIRDQGDMARLVARAVRPGGRVAVIDFAPGDLWFHGRDHGVTPEKVAEAFQQAGLTLVRHIDDWGGGMFLLLFERRIARE